MRCLPAFLIHPKCAGRMRNSRNGHGANAELSGRGANADRSKDSAPEQAVPNHAENASGAYRTEESGGAYRTEESGGTYRTEESGGPYRTENAGGARNGSRTADSSTFEPNCRVLNADDICEYIAAGNYAALLIAFGVFLCITAPVGAILTGDLNGFLGHFFSSVGTALLFVFVAAAVGFFRLSGQVKKPWKSLVREGFIMDEEACAIAVDQEQLAAKGLFFVCMIQGLCCTILENIFVNCKLRLHIYFDYLLSASIINAMKSNRIHFHLLIKILVFCTWL